MSPIVGSFAGASARGWGFLSTSLGGGNYWFGALVDSSRSSSSSWITGMDVDASGNFYAYHGLNDTSGLNQVFKVSSTPALSLQKSIVSTTASGNFGSMISDTAGGFLTTGKFDSTNFFGNITKWTSAGAQSWSYSSNQISSRPVAVTASKSPTSNIYVSAYPNTVAKFDSTGVLQWQRRSVSLGIAINGVGVDSSENVYLYTTSGTNQPTVAKWNSSGTLQWMRQVTTTGTAPSSTPALNLSSTDSSGNTYFIMSGGTFVKIDSTGAVAWSRVLTFSGGAAEVYSIFVDSVGDVYVGGRFGTASPYSAFVAKYNSSGTIQWQRSFTDTANPTFGTQITCLYVADNTVWATTPSRAGNSTAYPNVFKFPSTGTLTGTYTISGTSQTWVYAASSLTDSAGSVAVANPGFTDSAGNITFASRTETIATTTTAALSTKAIP